VYITDAQDKPAKQVFDIEDLMAKKIDVLVIAASESGPLDPIVGLWLAQMLDGKGNIVMLPGGAGASPGDDMLAGAKEILSQFPDINILDTQCTSWSPAEGKRIMTA